VAKVKYFEPPSHDSHLSANTNLEHDEIDTLKKNFNAPQAEKYSGHPRDTRHT
jgi:hypothetical protein